MELSSTLKKKSVFKLAIGLTKPGIIFGNLVTAIGGFFLGSGLFNKLTFFSMILGLVALIGAACIFNNIIDKELDSKMNRTRKRALPQGLLSVKFAFVMGSVLLLMSSATFYFFLNPLTLLCALVGFSVYVFLYSYIKYYSLHGMLVGSVAGAMPAVIGYTSVTNQLDGAALFLFLLVALWQMPHFIAIGIYRIEDYSAGQIPILPIVKGIYRAKWEMFFYIIAFFLTCYFFSFFKYVSPLFFMIMSLITIIWIYLSLRGFEQQDHQKWARKMFIYSLIIVMSMCFAIPFTKLR